MIIYLQDFNETKAIFANVKKLKGSSIFIQNDYSASTLRKGKLLWESAKNKKQLGKKVSLIHDRLRIGTEYFFWDETLNKRVKILKTGQSMHVEGQHDNTSTLSRD